MELASEVQEYKLCEHCGIKIHTCTKYCAKCDEELGYNETTKKYYNKKEVEWIREK